MLSSTGIVTVVVVVVVVAKGGTVRCPAMIGRCGSDLGIFHSSGLNEPYDASCQVCMYSILEQGFCGSRHNAQIMKASLQGQST